MNSFFTNKRAIAQLIWLALNTQLALLVQSTGKNIRTNCKMSSNSLLLALNRFQTLFTCFNCWLWTNKCRSSRLNRGMECILYRISNTQFFYKQHFYKQRQAKAKQHTLRLKATFVARFRVTKSSYAKWRHTSGY